MTKPIRRARYSHPFAAEGQINLLDFVFWQV
jgi:hypothetical protein